MTLIGISKRINDFIDSAIEHISKLWNVILDMDLFDLAVSAGVLFLIYLFWRWKKKKKAEKEREKERKELLERVVKESLKNTDSKD
jgi:lipoprotein signal peptidase